MSKTDKMIEAKKLDAARRYHASYKAIRQMIEAGEKINFYTVSDRAGVSRTYLYNHPEFKTLIKKYKDMSGIDDLAVLEEQHRQLKKKVDLLRSEANSLRDNWEKVED